MRNFVGNSLIITILITVVIATTTLTTDLFTSNYIDQILKISGSGSNILSQSLDIFNFGYSFVAGVLAAINPCGIVMLPAYLSLYVYNNNSEDNKIKTSKKLKNSLNIIFFVGLGFIALFSLIAMLVSLSSNLIGDIIPYVSLGLSFLILYFGIEELTGKKIFSNRLFMISSKIGDPRKISPLGFFLFGVSYGLASVGCALPIFISVVTKSINSSINQSSFVNFFLYSLGMLSVIGILTLTTFASVNVTQNINSFFRRWSGIIFGIFLTFAGTFMLSYWIYDLKLLS